MLVLCDIYGLLKKLGWFCLLVLSTLNVSTLEAALGDPLILSANGSPVVTGNGVGQVIIFEDAGWLDSIANQTKDVTETAVDLRGEVVEVIGSPSPVYSVTGDDFRVRLEGVGQLTIKWEIYEAVAGSGNGATGVLGIGSPSVLVKDIDGVALEHVGSNLNNLKSYAVEAGPPVSDLMVSTATVPFVILSGTNSHSSSDTEAMVKFSWEDVSSFEIFYKADSGGRNFDQDGDGDINFISENVVDPPPTITNGANHINDANKATYDINGTCTALGNAINLTLTDTITTIGPLATTCLANGTFSLVTDVTTLNDGAVSVISQIDDGVNAVVNDVDSVTKDTLAPTVTLLPDLTSGTDSGTLNSDDVTNIVNPDFTLTCTTGNTVNLFVDTVAAGTGNCVGGSVTITSTQSLTEGNNVINFNETDPYDNTSGLSPNLTVVLETQSSAAPTIATPTAGQNVAAGVTVTGSCVTGETVSVSNAHLVLSPISAVCAGSAYSLGVTFAAVADGNTEVLSVTQTDYVGNVSPAATVSVNVDTSAPGNGSTNTLLTNDTTPALSGTLAAPTNATDVVMVEVNLLTYPAVNNGDGTWDIADNILAALPEGTYDVQVTVTDLVGNASVNTDSLVLEIDTQAPVALVVDSPLNASIVSTQTPTISGSGATTGDTITVLGNLGETCTVVVGATGAWSCVIAPGLAEGGPQNLTVTATDPAGNVSPTSTVAITIDTTNPTPPVVNSPAHGDFTNNTTPTFTGVGEVGATVTVSEVGGANCSVVVPAGGNWSCDIGPALTPAALYNFQATQTDGGGNTSSATLVGLNVDTVSPSLTLERSVAQLAITATDAANFTLTFSEAINLTTFTSTDITLSGTNGTIAAGPTEIAPNNGTTFEFRVTGMAEGETVTAVLAAGVVADLAGNVNTASTGGSNWVTYDTSVDTDGDGLTDLVEGLIGTNILLGDSDGNGSDDDNNDLDNIHPLVELAAPNNGDANGDGFVDAAQTEVSSLPNTTNGLYNSLESANAGATNCGQINKFSSLKEFDLSVPDGEDDYPLGLWDLEIECNNPGDTAEIVIYLDKVYDTREWKYKKFNNVLNQYSDISNIVTYGIANIGALTVTTVSYSVTDGGVNDEDGVANGVIVDPAGPSIPFVPEVVVASSGSKGTATGGRGRYSGQTREEYQATQQYSGEVTKHNFEEAYAFSQKEVAKLNAGHNSQTLTYTDAYGREKFAGYQSGRLALDDLEKNEKTQIMWRTDREKTDIETVTAQRQQNNVEESYLSSAPSFFNKPRYSVALFKDVDPSDSIYQMVMDAYTLRLVLIKDEAFKPFSAVTKTDLGFLFKDGQTGDDSVSAKVLSAGLKAHGIEYKSEQVNRLKLVKTLSDHARKVAAGWFNSAHKKMVEQRLSNFKDRTFKDLNSKPMLDNSAKRSLERASAVDTIINRREQGAGSMSSEDVLRFRLGFEYADPNNPGWMPEDLNSGRAAIKGKNQTIIKNSEHNQRVYRRDAEPVETKIIKTKPDVEIQAGVDTDIQ